MNAPQNFDFDSWARLAKESPALFEVKRQATIEAFIASAPVNRQRRLRGLQFQIDMERQRAKTPLAACVRVYQMMLDSFHGQLMPALRNERPLIKKTQPRSATILNFRTQADRRNLNQHRQGEAN